VVGWQGRSPPVGTGRAGQESRRRADRFHNPGRRRQQRREESHDGTFDVVTPSTEKLTSSIILDTLQSRGIASENKSVHSLHELIMEFLDLAVLLRPLPSASLLINHIDILVIVDQRFDGIHGQLEGNLV
jgi:hypothetical protein